jgi:hypothetical protein
MNKVLGILILLASLVVGGLLGYFLGPIGAIPAFVVGYFAGAIAFPLILE